MILRLKPALGRLSREHTGWFPHLHQTGDSGTPGMSALRAGCDDRVCSRVLYAWITIFSSKSLSIFFLAMLPIRSFSAAGQEMNRQILSARSTLSRALERNPVT